jgi:selenocysteine lyase/cysteine desulfurase
MNEKSASIVPFRVPGKNSGALLEELEKKKVKLALRNGYIRASFHFINDLEEIRLLLDLL